ncbi:MAG: hypothetical protein ABFD76_14155 [Smithella sp.]
MNIVKIFAATLQFPCGPRTTCCSVGQSPEMVDAFVSSIKTLGVIVKTYSVEDERTELFSNYPDVGEMLKEFGPGITPILIFNDEVVAMGVSTPELAAEVIKEKMLT